MRLNCFQNIIVSVTLCCSVYWLFEHITTLTLHSGTVACRSGCFWLLSYIHFKTFSMIFQIWLLTYSQNFGINTDFDIFWTEKLRKCFDIKKSSLVPDMLTLECRRVYLLSWTDFTRRERKTGASESPFISNTQKTPGKATVAASWKWPSSVAGYRRGSSGHCEGLFSPGHRPPPSYPGSSGSGPSWPESLRGHKRWKVFGIWRESLTATAAAAAHLHALQTWGWRGFVCRTSVRFCTACARNIAVEQTRGEVVVSARFTWEVDNDGRRTWQEARPWSSSTWFCQKHLQNKSTTCHYRSKVTSSSDRSTKEKKAKERKSLKPWTHMQQKTGEESQFSGTHLYLGGQLHNLLCGRQPL